MPNSTTAVLLNDYNTQQVLLNNIEWMFFFAFVLAVLFTLVDRESRASVRHFISDLMVRWGLAGLGLWTIVLVFFGLYELGLQRGLFHAIPFIGIAEYGGVWGVAVAGAIALLFFVSSLFFQALIRTPNAVKVIRSPYYPYLEEYARYLNQWWLYYQQYQYHDQYQDYWAQQQEAYTYTSNKQRERSF